MPAASARWPPAELPVSTSRLVSMPWSSPFSMTHRTAHRQSSTAAGACAIGARRYSTLTTAQPISRYGSSVRKLDSLLPNTWAPPW